VLSRGEEEIEGIEVRLERFSWLGDRIINHNKKRKEISCYVQMKTRGGRNR